MTPDDARDMIEAALLTVAPDAELGDVCSRQALTSRRSNSIAATRHEASAISLESKSVPDFSRAPAANTARGLHFG